MSKDNTPTKTCTACGETKPLDEFHVNNAAKDGHLARCKPCQNAAGRDVHRKRRDAERKYQRTYNQTHREQANRNTRRWRAANPDKRLAGHRDWHARNPGARATYENERRAKKLGVESARVDRLAVAMRDGWICQICSDSIDPNATYLLETGKRNPQYLHVDHIIPLSRGGTHTYNNVQATHATCNLKKYNSISDNEQEAA